MAANSPLPRLDVIHEDTAGIDFGAFMADRRRRWSVERGIEIISEASRHIPDDLKDRHPEVPWRQVAGIGNFLRHEYMGIAHDTIWAVVRDHLPGLRAAVIALIARVEADEAS